MEKMQAEITLQKESSRQKRNADKGLTTNGKSRHIALWESNMLNAVWKTEASHRKREDGLILFVTFEELIFSEHPSMD